MSNPALLRKTIFLGGPQLLPMLGSFSAALALERALSAPGRAFSSSPEALVALFKAGGASLLLSHTFSRPGVEAPSPAEWAAALDAAPKDAHGRRRCAAACSRLLLDLSARVADDLAAADEEAAEEDFVAEYLVSDTASALAATAGVLRGEYSEDQLPAPAFIGSEDGRRAALLAALGGAGLVLREDSVQCARFLRAGHLGFDDGAAQRDDAAALAYIVETMAEMQFLFSVPALAERYRASSALRCARPSSPQARAAPSLPLPARRRRHPQRRSVSRRLRLARGLCALHPRRQAARDAGGARPRRGGRGQGAGEPAARPGGQSGQGRGRGQAPPRE